MIAAAQAVLADREKARRLEPSLCEFVISWRLAGYFLLSLLLAGFLVWTACKMCCAAGQLGGRRQSELYHAAE